MNRLQRNQNGFTVVEALLVFVIVAIIGGTGWYVYNANKKTNSTYNEADRSSQSTAKFSKKNTKTPAKASIPTAKVHTDQEAVAFVQTTYDDYLAALDKANNDSTNTQPVAQVGLTAVKANLSPELYTKAAAVTQATPFSCTAQYVTDKYTASPASNTDTSATVAVSISNGDGLSTKGMTVVVDLTSLMITAVNCSN